MSRPLPRGRRKEKDLDGASGEDEGMAQPPEGEIEKEDRVLRDNLSNLEEDERQLRKDRVDLARNPLDAIDEITAPRSEPETNQEE